MASVLRSSSAGLIRSGRCMRAFQSSATSRNRSSRICRSPGGGRWWRRSDISRAISASRSTTARRRTSVGWAVSTGATRIFATRGAAASAPPSRRMASGRVRGSSSGLSSTLLRTATSSPRFDSIAAQVKARAR